LKSSGSYFSPEFFKFLRSLARNNNRVWFQKNKPRYERFVLTPSLRFIKDAGKELRAVSPYLVADPRPFGGSLFRIYRDLRFSKDKSPYKTNVALLQGQESLQDQCGHGVLAPAWRKEVLHRTVSSPVAWAMFCRCGHLAS